MVSDSWEVAQQVNDVAVLILVLMEYGLWPRVRGHHDSGRLVLILVLMEYGLWLRSYFLRNIVKMRLNPCSNGIWSLTRAPLRLALLCWVLILVLMEYGLWLRLRHCGSNPHWVLILVLMEYGLWHKIEADNRRNKVCLNPCSNGIWSLTRKASDGQKSRLGLNPCSNGIWSLTWLSWR